MKRRLSSPHYADDALTALAIKISCGALSRSASIATAESCTGGWIAKTLTDIPGSSAWFIEGFITYSNAAKCRSLRISPTLIEKHGAVSDRVVVAMARGALICSSTSMAVAVTGIAGPGGAVPGKPVGTVWLAWASRHGRHVSCEALRLQFRGGREAIRRKTVHAALSGLLRRLR